MLSAVRQSYVSRRFSRRLATVLTMSLMSGLAVVSGAQARTAQVADRGAVASDIARAAPTTPNRPAAFGLQPASAKGGDGRPDFLYGGGPGAVIHDHVALVNIGTQPLTLDLYAADAKSGTGGQLTLSLPGDKQTGVGAWVSLDAPKQVTLPPRTVKGPYVRVVAFAVHIPRDASPGDHVGAVLVSLHTAPSATGGSSLGLNQRVGARVYLRVAGPVHPALTVEGLKAKYKTHDAFNPIGTGDVLVSYQVKNTGNVILSGTQAVSASGLLASGKASGLPAIPQMLPGDTISMTTVVKNSFPQVLLSVKVKLHPIAQVGEVDPGLRDSSRSVSVGAIPWALIVLILLLVGGAGYLYWRRRDRLRRNHEGRHGPPQSRSRSVPVGAR